MKMTKQVKRMLALIMMMTLIVSVEVQAETSQPPVPESPSAWALWDVQMASTYGLGDLATYQAYTESIDDTAFLKVQATFETKFKVSDETKLESDQVSRYEVLKELYDVMAEALALEADLSRDQVLDYYVTNGLIAGYGDQNYSLDQAVTCQEMLVFAKRVYDHLTYALGLEAKGTYWKVFDDNNTVYLLGSIHVTDDTVYPLSKTLLKDFVSSSALVVEANTLYVNPEDTAYIQAKMMLEGEVTIDSLISEETYKVYAEKAAGLGLTPEVYNKLKPWYAAMVLQSVSMSQASFSGAMGIDVYFQYLASGHLPILEVEGIKYQIDLFDAFSPELQEGYLQSALSDDTSGTDLLGEMLAAWKAGDADVLESLIFTDAEMTELEKEFSDKLWDARNLHMTDYVEALLADENNQDYFFIVGAGHMVSDKGIIATLRDRGYEVVSGYED